MKKLIKTGSGLGFSNSHYNFIKKILYQSENLIRVMADRMVEDGYLAAGYEYIIVDDCWLATTRDSMGRLQPDAKRFPSVNFIYNKIFES